MVLNEKINAPRALEGKGNENEKPSCVDNRGVVSDGRGPGGAEAGTTLEHRIIVWAPRNLGSL